MKRTPCCLAISPSSCGSMMTKRSLSYSKCRSISGKVPLPIDPKPIMTMGPEILAWIGAAADEDIGFGLRGIRATTPGRRDQETKGGGGSCNRLGMAGCILPMNVRRSIRLADFHDGEGPPFAGGRCEADGLSGGQ